MSGQQIGTAVGFVAGFFLPGGPQVWAAVGGALGGYISPTQLQGPRLTDGMAVTAQDGIPNPWGFGTFAVGCNIINAFDLVEHAHTDDGKGSGVENTTYSYSRSYALGICRAKRKADGTYDPIAGILRATHNGKVVYYTGPDATAEQLAQNAKFLQTFKFYLGGEDQLPDPTLESYLGTGNVSAYRGQVYMVATDEDQAQHGSIGSWEFVVSMGGTVTPVEGDGLVAARLSEFADQSFPLTDAESDYTYSGSIQNEAGGYETFFADTIDEIKAHFANHLGGVRTYSEFIGYCAGTGAINNSATDFGQSDHTGQPSVVDNGTLYLIYNDSTVTSYNEDPFSDTNCTLIGLNEEGVYSPRGDRLTRVPVAEPGDGNIAASNFCGDDTIVVYYPALWIQVGRKRIAPRISVPAGAQEIPGLPGYYAMPDGTISGGQTYVAQEGFFKVLVTDSEPTTIDGRSQYTYYEQGPAVENDDPNYNNQAFWEAALADAVDTGTLPAEAADWTYNDEYPTGVELVYNGEYAGSETVTPAGVVLSTIVSEVCLRSGLESTDIDVSDLTDVVKGFKVAVESTGESILQSLMPAFFFDAGEWDDKLRFIKRGGDVVAEIDVDDLVERDGPAIEETQVQEVELLRKVSVKAMDPDAGYVETTQVAERRTSTVDAKGEQTIQVPIVLDKDTQAQIADKRMKVAWGEPRRFGFTLPYTRPDLTVTDNIGLTNKAGKRQRVRLMEMSEDTGRIEISEASLDRQSNYTSEVEGVTKDAPTSTAPGIIGPTYFWAGNLPSLRTSENVPGMHIAACGYLSAWGGADILLSTDGGTSYQRVATIIQPSTMGTLTADVTDIGEPISVFMNSGSLSSITDDQIANRMNGFAITTDGESEVGQFKTATLGDPREYDLTDTVRGALNTTAASHDLGDPFVLLATSPFLPIDISHDGKTLKFKAVSLGTSPDDAEVYEVVFNPLFTSVNIDSYTNEAGETYVNDAGSTYYRTS